MVDPVSILFRYVLRQVTRNVLISGLVFTALFLFVDFFDRIDNVLEGNASFWLGAQYFALKIPFFIQMTLPMSMLVSSLFTIGMMTKNSELTAMRASGIRVVSISLPIFLVGGVVAAFSLLLSEVVVPYTQRRVHEIYNIDIQKRDKAGFFSRDKFWFRHGNDFYSVSHFDSRENALLDLSIFTLDELFLVKRRKDAQKAAFIGSSLGWSMQNVQERSFLPEGPSAVRTFRTLPLPIEDEPKKFYLTKTDPSAMSFDELRGFMQEQSENGLSTKSYMGDLYAKLSFPLINIIIPLVVIPFAVGSSRSKSLAAAAMAAILTGFSYYVIHSLAIALSRAELWPPLLSAWAANIILAFVGGILFLGAESPE